MTVRVGIYGGMFDPVHNGHVEAAVHACELLELDRLKLVPCNRPNHRSGVFASGQDRLHMLELATAGQKALEADPVELERGGVSYMADTLDAMFSANQSAALVLVLGMDAFNGLPDWHRFEDISQRCHLLVLSRPGTTINPLRKSQIDRYWQQQTKPSELFQDDYGCYYIENDFDLDVSSTAVREAILNGKKLTGLLDASVAAYISDHDLYSTDSLKIEGKTIEK